MRPTEFAGQLNVSLANGWGIVRTVTDLCMKMPEGKYVLVKDPNRVSFWLPRSITCVSRENTNVLFVAYDSPLCRPSRCIHRGRGRGGRVFRGTGRLGSIGLSPCHLLHNTSVLTMPLHLTLLCRAIIFLSLSTEQSFHSCFDVRTDGVTNQTVCLVTVKMCQPSLQRAYYSITRNIRKHRCQLCYFSLWRHTNGYVSTLVATCQFIHPFADGIGGRCGGPRATRHDAS